MISLGILVMAIAKIPNLRPHGIYLTLFKVVDFSYAYATFILCFHVLDFQTWP